MVGCETMRFLGKGYGEAQISIRAAREVEAAVERLGNVKLQYLEFWHGSDDRYDDNHYEAGERWVDTSVRKVLKGMATYTASHRVSGTGRDGKPTFYYVNYKAVADLSEIKTISDLAERFCENSESDDGGVAMLVTLEEAKKMRAEQRRKSLESTAAAFAAQCGHKVGTREYVLAARAEIDGVRYQRSRWNDGETRMEEWAACQFAGVGASVYYDDLNFENERFDSRLDRLGEVLEWLEEVCPLLMRQIEAEAGVGEDE